MNKAKNMKKDYEGTTREFEDEDYDFEGEREGRIEKTKRATRKNKLALKVLVAACGILSVALLATLMMLTQGADGPKVSQSSLDLFRLPEGIETYSDSEATAQLVAKVHQLTGTSAAKENSSIPEFNAEGKINRVGLRNGDNRCFYNSLLQALYHDRPFRRMVGQLRWTNLMALKLSNLFAYMDHVQPGTVIDSRIKAFLPNTLANGRFQDAEEALTAIFNELPAAADNNNYGPVIQSSLIHNYKNCSINSDGSPESLICLPLSVVDVASDDEHRAKCEGKYCSQDCSRSSDASSGPGCIQFLLDNFFKREQLEVIDSQRYEGITSSEKYFTVYSHSDTLIVQLKRFTMDTNGQSKKISTPILANDEIKLPDGSQYRLKSFIYHSGRGLNGGHYIAFIRDTDSDPSFTEYNDSEITLNSSRAEEFKNNAYLYFYELVPEQQ